MRQILTILIVAVTFSAFGQRTIEGEVRLKDDNSVLLGVNVVEKGTTNGVLSDTMGKFKITCKSTNPTLQFSFIGLITTEIVVDKEY